MSQLQQLNLDFWNAVPFFLTVSTIAAATMVAVYASDRFDPEKASSGITLLFLAVVATLFWAVGFFLLRKTRKYYVQGLLCKTLLECRLGFYDQPDGVNLVMPWRVDKEEWRNKLLEDPESWMKCQMWRVGTIALFLLTSYVGVLFLYLAVIALSVHAIKT